MLCLRVPGHSVGGDKGAGNLLHIIKIGLAPVCIFVPLHIEQQVRFHIADAAIGEDTDIDRGAHRIVVAIAAICPLGAAANAEQKKNGG